MSPLLPYRLARTRNRTSRATLEGDTVVIRLAGGMPAAQEHRHIEILLKRMAKVQARNQKKILIDPFRVILSGETILDVPVLDTAKRRFLVAWGNSLSGRLRGGIWFVKKPTDISEKTFHRFLWRLISISERGAMEQKVREINRSIFGFDISKTGLRFMKVRWGSCSPKGIINLNTALLFLPEEILDYIIIHELSHLKHPNHSPYFWNEVAVAMPDFRERMKQLKKYRLPQF